MTGKFGFDLACADDVQFADQFDQADVVFQFPVLKLHDFTC
jgi:uncharacterized protein (DUF362 family)